MLVPSYAKVAANRSKYLNASCIYFGLKKHSSNYRGISDCEITMESHPDNEIAHMSKSRSGFWCNLVLNESSHICVSHGTWRGRVTIWVSHVTHMSVSCHTCEWVLSHVWMGHVTHLNESCHTYEWVMLNAWMSHVSRMNESCHKCRSMHGMRLYSASKHYHCQGYFWMSHVTHADELYILHKNVPCHIQMSIHIYIYIYINISVRKCLFIHIYIYMYIYGIYIYIHVFIYFYIYICI